MSKKNQNTTTSYLEWDSFVSLITRLENDANYKFCLLIAIGTFTGLRISDLLTIKYSDILTDDTFTIREKKTGKERRIKISKDLKTIVNRIVQKLQIRDLNTLIFLNKYGTKAIDQSYCNVKLKEIFKQYHIKSSGNTSSHIFRKTLGRRVMFLNNYSNESLVLLMELFGHSSMSITKKYLGIRQQEIYSIYDSLSL